MLEIRHGGRNGDGSMMDKKLFATLGVLVLGAGLMGVPALAKCPKPCKQQITAAFKSCKSGCAKGKAGKDCRKACRTAKVASKMKCRAATNPTTPTCSPSGAFLDDR